MLIRTNAEFSGEVFLSQVIRNILNFFYLEIILHTITIHDTSVNLANYLITGKGQLKRSRGKQ